MLLTWLLDGSDFPGWDFFIASVQVPVVAGRLLIAENTPEAQV